jgi:hypothetical protein
MRVSLRLFMLGCTLLLVGSGCSSSQPPAVSKDPQVYKIQTRKLPPDPVYNRVTWAHLPDSMPGISLPRSASAQIAPIITFDVNNAKLEDAARSLAATMQYASYCSSVIADQRLTLRRLGTIDELAEAISQQARISVSVDHEGRVLRFLPQLTETPRFYSEREG